MSVRILKNILSGTQCGRYEVNEPGNVITSTDYSDILGEQHECTWFIQSPNKALAIQLNVEAMTLAAIHVPNDSVSLGTCVIPLLIQFVEFFIGFVHYAQPALHCFQNITACDDHVTVVYHMLNGVDKLLPATENSPLCLSPRSIVFQSYWQLAIYPALT